MSSWQAFWYMGGYAGYVWSAYALAVGVLTINILRARYIQRRIQQEIQQVREAKPVGSLIFHQVDHACTLNEDDT